MRGKPATSGYATLEILLHQRDSDHYTVEMRFSHPDSDADMWLPSREPAVATFDLERLSRLLLQPDAYGQCLSDGLFANRNVYALFQHAANKAQESGIPLRLRLCLEATALELQSLRWETLRDPISQNMLLTSEHIFFSRYLGSMSPIKLRPRSDMRALVMIANPTDLADYQPGGQTLTPFDVSGELERARKSLGTMPITALTTSGSVTMQALTDQLREGYDILYLVAHGAVLQSEPYLWMEDETGIAAVVPGNDLVARIQEQPLQPRLVVLASCQSALEEASSSNRGTSQAQEPASPDASFIYPPFSSLGPRLAEAGVPAVVAMQGNVAVQTIEQFMPIFFAELQRHGLVDQAMSVARSAVREERDWWMPVLFMRLRSGRIWYVPGFGSDAQDFEKWPSIIRNIQRGNCTPILGQRLTDTLMGSPEDIARSWADVYRFPLAVYQRNSLPQVAQFLSVNQDMQFPREELLEHLRNGLLKQYAQFLPGDWSTATLEELFSAVGKLRRERNPDDPYRVLGELPFRLYITTNLSNLLTEALKSAGKQPREELCRWNAELDTLDSIFDQEPDYRPDANQPLVYYLFGNSTNPGSLVVTEDDYFDYLIGVTSNKDLIPVVVRRSLSDTALLFLGFRMDDWNFRVLFRSVMGQEGRVRRKRYAHVAAQIDPEEGQFEEPERARRYLQSYFEGSDVSIFWGSVDDFIKELKRRMKG